MTIRVYLNYQLDYLKINVNLFYYSSFHLIFFFYCYILFILYATFYNARKIKINMKFFLKDTILVREVNLVSSINSDVQQLRGQWRRIIIFFQLKRDKFMILCYIRQVIILVETRGYLKISFTNCKNKFSKY